jgi:hypothetical protein
MLPGSREIGPVLTTEEIMPRQTDEATEKARADRIAARKARRQTLRMFFAIRDRYPLLDDGEAALVAFDAMLAEVDDPEAVQRMLLDAVTTIAARNIAPDRLRPLAVFIARGNWRTDLWMAA